jgi:hypothetical protein
MFYHNRVVSVGLLTIFSALISIQIIHFRHNFVSVHSSVVPDALIVLHSNALIINNNSPISDEFSTHF